MWKEKRNIKAIRWWKYQQKQRGKRASALFRSSKDSVKTNICNLHYYQRWKNERGVFIQIFHFLAKKFHTGSSTEGALKQFGIYSLDIRISMKIGKSKYTHNLCFYILYPLTSGALVFDLVHEILLGDEILYSITRNFYS